MNGRACSVDIGVEASSFNQSDRVSKSIENEREEAIRIRELWADIRTTDY